MSAKRSFRGWPQVGVGFLIYGLGIAPAYYSWGFLAPELARDLHLSREQIGNTFGLFTLTFALASPLAALAVARFGLRVVVCAGSAVAALGFWWTSAAQSATEITIVYALVGGVGIGFSTLLPAQVLPVYWFRRYRARATALILVGAAVFGTLVPPVDDWILRSHDWRAVWKCIAGISLGVAALAAVFLRTRPEDVGQRPDGDAGDAPIPESGASPVAHPPAEPGTAQVVWTPRFLVVTFACLTNTLPWRVFTAHGRLHFEDLGFTSTVAAAVLGFRVGTSAIGRLSGAAGDFVSPPRLLAASLALAAIGMTGLATTTSSAAATVWIALLGFGYGAGYTTEPLVIARMFGTRAFVGSNGLRIAIAGVGGWLAPRWAGAAADRTDSYASSFAVLAGLCVLGALAIALSSRQSRHVREPTSVESGSRT